MRPGELRKMLGHSQPQPHASMVELVYTLVLGTSLFGDAGSTPVRRTQCSEIESGFITLAGQDDHLTRLRARATLVMVYEAKKQGTGL